MRAWGLACVVTMLAGPIFCPAWAQDEAGSVEDASESSDGTDNLDEAFNPGTGHTPRFIFSPTARAAVRWRVNPDFSLETFVKYRHAALEPPTLVRATNVEGGVVASARIGAGVRWRNQIGFRQAYVNFFGPRDYTSLIVVSGVSRDFDLGAGFAFSPSFDVSYQQADVRAINRFKYTWEGSLSYSLTDKLEVSLTPHFDVRAYTALPVRRIDTTLRMGAGLDYELMDGIVIGGEIGYEYTRTNLSRARFARWVLEPQLKAQVRF